MTVSEEAKKVAEMLESCWGEEEEITVPFEKFVGIIDGKLNGTKKESENFKDRIRFKLRTVLYHDFGVVATRDGNLGNKFSKVKDKGTVFVTVENNLEKNEKLPDMELVSTFSKYKTQYIPIPDFTDIKEAVKEGEQVLLVGPKGCGKSRTLEEVFACLGLSALRIAMGEVREPADLIGSKEIVEKNGVPITKFQPGMVTECAMAKNRGVILDEIDSVSPSLNLALNKILENEGGIMTLPTESGVEFLEIDPTFRIAATGNTFGYGDSTGQYNGTKVQNRATFDRLGPKFDLDYNPSIEKRLISNYLPEAVINSFYNDGGEKTARGIILKIRESDEINDTIGLRSILRFARSYNRLGWHRSMSLLLNDINPDFHDAIVGIIVAQLGKEFTPSRNQYDKSRHDFISKEWKEKIIKSGFCN